MRATITNKLLTGIILLCFSVVANADIYFCEATHQALIGSDDQSSSNADAKFIVDTSRGVRFNGGADGWVTEDYTGECNRHQGYLIECLGGEVAAFDRLVLWDSSTGSSIYFTFVRSNIYLPLISSHHGECTKV
ncbi:MAG: hypothetical protein CMQ14_07145 [Gammaproteobacteria bacterium]|nr:hypothetical protein [Gammaproteobacteria bacterium]